MKKAICLIIAVILLTSSAVCGAEVIPFPGQPVVGIAWRADTDSEFFTNMCRAVEAAGGSGSCWIRYSPLI